MNMEQIVQTPKHMDAEQIVLTVKSFQKQCQTASNTSQKQGIGNLFSTWFLALPTRQQPLAVMEAVGNLNGDLLLHTAALHEHPIVKDFVQQHVATWLNKIDFHSLSQRSPVAKKLHLAWDLSVACGVEHPLFVLLCEHAEGEDDHIMSFLPARAHVHITQKIHEALENGRSWMPDAGYPSLNVSTAFSDTTPQIFGAYLKAVFLDTIAHIPHMLHFDHERIAAVLCGWNIQDAMTNRHVSDDQKPIFGLNAQHEAVHLNRAAHIFQSLDPQHQHDILWSLMQKRVPFETLFPKTPT